jgi:Na+-translocating ferredoxin:NAD+ oxidoreductase RnfG subunit
MLDKLKVALTLLVIGSISGVLIWGTNALTEDRIEANREAARYEVYADMFEGVDLTKIETEAIENSLVEEKLTMYNSSGTLLGYAFRGSANNALGYVNVVVGILANGTIVDVVITETDNTPTYVAGLESDYLGNLKNQSISELSFDSSTGATITYNAVKAIVEASVILVAGDPILEQYQTLFAEADRYESNYNFATGTIKEEVSILNASDALIGYIYKGDITVEETVYEVGFAVDSDLNFLGVVALDPEAPMALTDALSTFDSYIGQSIDSITVDITSDLKAELELLATHAFMRADEDEATRTLREYFIEASSIGDVEAITDDVLTEARPVYDSESNLIGYVYLGAANGYYPDVTLEVAVYLDGTISSAIVVSHDETPGTSDPGFNSIDAYIGKTDLTEVTADVYAGATYTGEAVRDVIVAAQTHVLEREGA